MKMKKVIIATGGVAAISIAAGTAMTAGYKALRDQIETETYCRMYYKTLLDAERSVKKMLEYGVYKPQSKYFHDLMEDVDLERHWSANVPKGEGVRINYDLRRLRDAKRAMVAAQQSMKEETDND